MNQTPTPTPTVGHIVHFYESEEYAVTGVTKTVDGRIAPKAAIITCVTVRSA